MGLLCVGQVMHAQPRTLGADLVAAAAFVTKLQKLQRLQALPGPCFRLGLSPCVFIHSGASDSGGLHGGGLSPTVPCFLRYRGPRKPAWIKAVPYVPCVPYRKSEWLNFARCCAGGGVTVLPAKVLPPISAGGWVRRCR